MPLTIFYGAVISPETLNSYKALSRCLLAVGPSGTIEWLVDDVPAHSLQDTLTLKGCIDVDVTVLRDGEFLLPGFIDTHTHAPQFPNLGSGQQYELLDWLNNVTFPTEAKFADVSFAGRAYESVVKRAINCGTTTCCYYATLHLESTKVLADLVHVAGQRAFIGKCNMDRESPANYVERSVSDSMSATKDLISHIRSLPHTHHTSSNMPLVQPILTPRFAISCTDTLLTSLGELAGSDPSLTIQTHISENKSEIAFVQQLFPSSKNYADVYDSFGLLRNNTILAHGVHLTDDEIELIKLRQAGISHCPTSNFNLRSGVAPIGKYLDKGVKVGLGTDVSGGYCPSILNAIQNASIASKVVACAADTPTNPALPGFADKQLPVATLLYLATMGGAEVCCLQNQVGSFAEGKAFDALLVSTRGDSLGPNFWDPELLTEQGTARVLTKEDLDGLLERFMFCGDDRNINRVYVQGRWIGGTAWRGPLRN